jgi:hypothetical protein
MGKSSYELEMPGKEIKFRIDTGSGEGEYIHVEIRGLSNKRNGTL